MFSAKMKRILHLIYILLLIQQNFGNKDLLPLPPNATQQYKKCIEKYQHYEYEKNLKYCNATYDSYLCWPPTRAGDNATQNCPEARLSDTTQTAFRKCSETGKWMGRRSEDTRATGWTNYTPCFPQEVQSLFVKFNDDDEFAQRKFEIAEMTRKIEIGGFSVSLVALSVSLNIFIRFHTLQNERTRIHISLFLAMTAQVLIRLTLYIDQAVTRGQQLDHTEAAHAKVLGIENIPHLCETFYVLLEYAISVMFMWMFIEGLHLHSVVTLNTLRDRITYKSYLIIGWGLPAIYTGIWAGTTAYEYSQEKVKRCWYGYNFTQTYWIVQGPRLSSAVINLLFLFNIIKVLVTKMSRTDQSEVDKAKKAVRAALVLVPLLGISNLLDMYQGPLDGTVMEFAAWSYSIHFLRSFQGFLIAVIYCFCNGEVRQVLRRYYANQRAMRQGRLRQQLEQREHTARPALFHFRFTRKRKDEVENRPSPSAVRSRPPSPWISMRELNWVGPRTTSNPRSISNPRSTSNAPSDIESAASRRRSDEYSCRSSRDIYSRPSSPWISIHELNRLTPTIMTTEIADVHTTRTARRGSEDRRLTRDVRMHRPSTSTPRIRSESQVRELEGNTLPRVRKARASLEQNYGTTRPRRRSDEGRVIFNTARLTAFYRPFTSLESNQKSDDEF